MSENKIVYTYRLMLNEDDNTFWMSAKSDSESTFTPMTTGQIVWLRNALAWFLPKDDPENNVYRCEVLDSSHEPTARNVIYFSDEASRNKFQTFVQAQFPHLEAGADIK